MLTGMAIYKQQPTKIGKIMTRKEQILKEIEQKDVFYDWNMSDEDFDILRDLVEEGKLETLDKYCGPKNNNCYCFVAKGNPFKVNWIPYGIMRHKLRRTCDEK